MSCEHLVCASCAGVVVDGRCQVCRAARAEVHGHHAFTVTPQLVLAVALLVAVLGWLLGS